MRLPPWGTRRVVGCVALAVATWLAGAAGSAWAQPTSAAASGIYTCVTADGRRLNADRPIDECRSREQKLLNRDGSVRRVIPPTQTTEEAAEAEARDRTAAAELAARADAKRRDRNLLARYPNEAAHQRARVAAADTVRAAIRTTDNRLRDLAVERRPLANEAEFYVGAEPAGRTRPHQPAVRRRTRASAPALGRCAGGLAWRAAGGAGSASASDHSGGGRAGSGACQVGPALTLFSPVCCAAARQPGRGWHGPGWPSSPGRPAR